MQEALQVPKPRPAGPVPLRRADIKRAGDGRRTSNASAVLRAVLDHGPVARSTIARLTALSPASVTGQCAELAALGLVQDVPQPVPAKGVGRPHVPVDIDVARTVVCALHIAVPSITLALLDLRGRVLAQEQRPQQNVDPYRTLSGIAQRIPGFLAEHAPARSVVGLGVASGGWVDPAAGVIVDHPLLGWTAVPVREIMADTGLPVEVDSHSRALVHAEQLFGPVRERARASVVHMFVGNVVDAAFATQGTVHQGPGSAAGTIAHFPLPDSADPCACGRIGCLQAAVSSATVARRAVELGIIPEPSITALVQAARSGQADAVRLLRERSRRVGRAAALLLDVLNPEVLVVVEAGAFHLTDCLAELRAEVRARSSVCREPERTVVASSFLDDVPAVAAGAVMLNAIYADPLTPNRFEPVASEDAVSFSLCGRD